MLHMPSTWEEENDMSESYTILHLASRITETELCEWAAYITHIRSVQHVQYSLRDFSQRNGATPSQVVLTYTHFPVTQKQGQPLAKCLPFSDSWLCWSLDASPVGSTGIPAALDKKESYKTARDGACQIPNAQISSTQTALERCSLPSSWDALKSIG